MIDPYCRKHGHWACPKCETGKRDEAGELIARLTLKLSEARDFIRGVEKCAVCSACSVKATEILKDWKGEKDE